MVGAAFAFATAGNDAVDIRDALDAREPERRGDGAPTMCVVRGSEPAPVLGEGGGGDAAIDLGLL